MFRWLTRLVAHERLAGHTAAQWYVFYRYAQNFQGDLASAVTAALREASTTNGTDDVSLATLLTTDPREIVRCLAAIKLGLNKSTEGEPALMVALNDQSEFVRRTSAQALVALDTVRGLAAVVAGSRHGHAVRSQAAQKLRGHGEEAIEAIPALLSLLRYPDINWRSHFDAAEALAAIGEPAIPALVQAFEQGEPRLRYYAAIALKEMNKTPELLAEFDPDLLAAIDEDLPAAHNAD